MDRQYNFYNVEASFRIFLSAGNKSIQAITIKNYLSDLRHFLGWFVLRLKVKNLDVREIHSENLSKHLTGNEIAQYKAYLEENKSPIKTINRRLSTLRKFCSFCISQGWMTENPAKKIQNIVFTQDRPTSELENDLMIEKFKKSLIEEGLDHQEAINISDDVKEVISYTFE